MVSSDIVLDAPSAACNTPKYIPGTGYVFLRSVTFRSLFQYVVFSNLQTTLLNLGGNRLGVSVKFLFFVVLAFLLAYEI